MSISDRAQRGSLASSGGSLARIVAGAVAVLACGACAGCATPALALHGAIAHPVAADGWPLTVEHFTPAPGSFPRKRPVVLCHGILANRHFFELEGDDSLPAVLARDGFDLTVVSDPIYFDDAAQDAYVPLDAALYERIDGGKLRL